MSAMIIGTQTAPERQFDFWIGDWECTGRSRNAPGKDEWTETKANNRIEKAFKDNVIQENFSMDGLVGMSVSVYVPAKKKWEQTWVDDQGSYISLAGEFNDGKMVLTTVPNPAAPERFGRMTFHKITKDSFTWDWEGSADGGKTWSLNWQLLYKRKG